MKGKAEIEYKLEQEEQDIKPYVKEQQLYESAGDYVRGWVAALRWVLDKS